MRAFHICETEGSLSKDKGGRKRKSWEMLASDTVGPNETLRTAAQRWLRQKEILHKTLVTSSNQGRRTLLAKCDQCIGCSAQYCMSFAEAGGQQMIVERTGACNDQKDLKKIRLLNAAKHLKRLLQK